MTEQPEQKIDFPNETKKLVGLVDLQLRRSVPGYEPLDRDDKQSYTNLILLRVMASGKLTMERVRRAVFGTMGSIPSAGLYSESLLGSRYSEKTKNYRDVAVLGELLQEEKGLTSEWTLWKRCHQCGKYYFSEQNSCYHCQEPYVTKKTWYVRRKIIIKSRSPLWQGEFWFHCTHPENRHKIDHVFRGERCPFDQCPNGNPPHGQRAATLYVYRGMPRLVSADMIGGPLDDYQEGEESYE